MSCKRCSGPCEQGRKPCPTPDACELRNDDGLEALGAGLLIAVAIVLALLMGVLLT